MNPEKITELGPMGFRILKKFTDKLDNLTFQDIQEEALRSVVLENLRNIGVVYLLYQNFGKISGKKQTSLLRSINLNKTKKSLIVLGGKEDSIHKECEVVIGYLNKL